jgi:hypothetical protein
MISTRQASELIVRLSRQDLSSMPTTRNGAFGVAGPAEFGIESREPGEKIAECSACGLGDYVGGGGKG